MKKNPASMSVVSESEARMDPYPYVWVNAEGEVRELSPQEKAYLETPFSFGDGGRPATKSSYQSKNGWGNLSGFCKRSYLPEGIEIEPYEKDS